MHTATFTFAKRGFDDAFHAQGPVITQVAQSVPSCRGGRHSLLQPIDRPSHPAARQRQGPSLNGSPVAMAQAGKRCGDGGIKHLLAPAPMGARPASGPPAVVR